jgi:hypothetical protein
MEVGGRRGAAGQLEREDLNRRDRRERRDRLSTDLALF